MTEVVAHQGLDVEKIARVCHEVNRAYCRSIGDDSQLSWPEAQDWQKTSAVNGVNFKLANPDASPERMHASWYTEKAEQGWTFGPVKDVDKKEHPCFVPYLELPLEQRVKDYLFSAVVEAMKS